MVGLQFKRRQEGRHVTASSLSGVHGWFRFRLGPAVDLCSGWQLGLFGAKFNLGPSVGALDTYFQFQMEVIFWDHELL